MALCNNHAERYWLGIEKRAMDKFCIFCGDKPQSKNLEHIIPQWLLKMTGDPTPLCQDRCRLN